VLAVEIRVLGEVSLYGGDGPVVLRRIGERIVLAVLAMYANEPVESTTLLRLVGEGGVDQIEMRTLVDYVNAVRAALQVAGGDRAVLPDARRRRGTYQLNIGPDLVDYLRFRTHVDTARAHAARGGHQAAADAFQLAVGEWRGPPFAGIDRAPIDGLRHELEEQHRAVIRELLTGQLHLGQHADVVRVARRMVGDYPTDDMVTLGVHALARDGRLAEIPAFCDYATQRLRALLDDTDATLGHDVQALVNALVRDPQESYQRLAAGSIHFGPTAVRAGAGEENAVRFSLPPDTIAFTGRTDELAAITATVTDAAASGGVVAIHAIDGMPGIGKTALAVHAAYRLADRYPDRRLFVDLHAHTPGQQPTDPTDALADLLRADGVDPRQLPDGLDARAALWRHRMSDKQALLVLDNVASTAQITPLLPGSPTVAVLITSRRQLGDLRHAAHLHLKVLPAADAVAMFLRLAPSAATEPDAVARLVGLCEFLPLAIGITASRFAARDTWTMTDLLTEIQDSRSRLLTVKSEDTIVAVAFDLSYRYLPSERQRFFRLLGLTPGVDFDGHAAAALTDTTHQEAVAQLDELYNDHLLDETAPHRYRMHDLIRAYAHTLTITTDPDHVREHALDRLLDYYQHTADRADTLIAHRHRSTAVPIAVVARALSGWDDATTWLRTERPNLLACLYHATTHNQHRRVLALTAGLTTTLINDGPWATAADLHHHAATAAARDGDRAGRAHALYQLGIVRRLIGDFAGAEDLLRQALDVYRAIDHRLGKANAVYELGSVGWYTGDYSTADDLLRQALRLYGALGHRLGQATALRELGATVLATGDYPGASDLLRQALDLYRAIGHRHGQANTLHELAAVRSLTGDYPAADDLLRHALELFRALGHRLGQAGVLQQQGIVRKLTGDYPGADDLFRQALELYTTLGSRQGRANVLHSLATLRRLTGDYLSAEDLFRQALDICCAIGHRHGQANAWTQLGVVRYLAGDHAGAEALLQQALTALHDTGARAGEAHALNHLGTLRRLTGHPDQAHTHHQQALALARGIQHQLEEGRALEGLGRATLDLGDLNTAATDLCQALNLYQQLGAPEATRLAADLADLHPLPPPIPTTTTDGERMRAGRPA
jgi:tetratricopeptide (TPR) repeat protein